MNLLILSETLVFAPVEAGAEEEGVEEEEGEAALSRGMRSARVVVGWGSAEEDGGERV